jgi:hypothetical protein
MCVQTAEPYVEPPNYLGMEIAISKMKMERQMGKIKSQPN